MRDPVETFLAVVLVAVIWSAFKHSTEHPRPSRPVQTVHHAVRH